MSKILKAIIAIMLAIAVLNLSGCKKQEKDSVRPDVETSSVSDITETSAKVGGRVAADGGTPIMERGICWAKEHNPVVTDFHVTTEGNVGSFACLLTNLETNTTYYTRAYAINSVGISYGSEISFVTLQNGNLPTVAISPSLDITKTTVFCSGSILDEGGSEVVEIGFCWSQNTNPTVDDSFVIGLKTSSDFYAYIDGLEPNTSYYIRAYARNDEGIGYSSEISITTLCNCPPIISVLHENGFLDDGSILSEMNTEYKFGFYMSSNPESQQPLESLKIKCNQYDWDWISLYGLTEYTYVGRISFLSKTVIEESEFMAIVTDVNGEADTVSFVVRIDEVLSLGSVEFEWIRQGPSQGTGLEQYGLYWEQNYKGVYAHIKPLDGVSLYWFNSSVWNEVNTMMSKKIAFMDAVEFSSVINDYCNVDLLSSNEYDDVIGTIMPDGTCHLLHITRCNVSNGYYTRFTITGEAK